MELGAASDDTSITATIDIVLDVGLAEDTHIGLASDLSRSTQTATEDHTRVRAIRSVLRDGSIANHHQSVTHDRCCLTAAIDITLNAGKTFGNDGLIVLDSRGIGESTNDDAGIGGAGSRGTETATVDTDDVDPRGVSGGILAVSSVVSPPITVVLNVDGGRATEGIGRSVGCITAAAIDAVELEAITALAEVGIDIDIDGDGTADITVDIGATEEVDDASAMIVDDNVAIDVGRLILSTLTATEEVANVTTENVDLEFNRLVGGTEASGIGASVEVLEVGAAFDDHLATATGSFVTATEGLVNDLFTVGRVVGDRQVDMSDITHLVGATIDLVDKAGIDMCGGRAENVSAGVVVGGIGVVVVTCLGVSVTATKDAIDATAVNNHIVVAGAGCIAAAVDRVDGVLVAVIDTHVSGTVHTIHRRMGSLVTATVDSTEGVTLRASLSLCRKVFTRELGGGCHKGFEGVYERITVGGIVRSMVDVHLGVTEGGTREVVGTENIAMDDGVTLRGAADVDSGVTAVGGEFVTHGGHGATTVDATQQFATEDVDTAVAVDTAGEDAGSPFDIQGEAGSSGVVGGGVVVLTQVVAAIASSENITVVVLVDGSWIDNRTDVATVDGDGGVAQHHALFGAAIDAAPDGAAVDGDATRAGATHGDPMRVFGIHIALAAAEDVTSAGVEEGSIVVIDSPLTGVLVASTLTQSIVNGHDIGELLSRADGAAVDGDGGSTGAIVEDTVVAPPADAGHLATTEDTATNDGIAGDGDGGVSDAACEDIVVVVDVALTGTIDVADAPVATQQRVDIVGTDGAATDGDDGVAERDTRKGAGIIDAGECQAATAEDGAVEGATGHVDGGVTAHTSAGGIDIE